MGVLSMLIYAVCFIVSSDSSAVYPTQISIMTPKQCPRQLYGKSPNKKILHNVDYNLYEQMIF